MEQRRTSFGSTRSRGRTFLTPFKKGNNKPIHCNTIEVTKGDLPPEPRYGHTCCFYKNPRTQDKECLLVYGGVTQDIPSEPSIKVSTPTPDLATVWKLIWDMDSQPFWKRILNEGIIVEFVVNN